jgi:hypothetical protein
MQWRHMALYHYTDLNAVYSILKNNKVWMTDIRYLNDSHGLHDGIKVLAEGIKTPTTLINNALF